MLRSIWHAGFETDLRCAEREGPQLRLSSVKHSFFILTVVALRTYLDRIVQQQPVATPHHLFAMRDETTCLVLSRVALEILLRAAKTKQDFGDGTIALASQACIERTQGQNMPKLVGNIAEIPPGRATFEGPPEAPRRMCAKLHEVVQRQRDGIECRRIWDGFGHPELMLDAIHLPNAVPAIGCAAQDETVEMCEIDGRLSPCGRGFGRDQFDGLRLESGRPEQRIAIRRFVGVVREIATPNAERRLPVRLRSAVLPAQEAGSPAGSRDCDGDIPRRNRRRGWSSYARKPPAPANRSSAWRILPTHGRTGQRPD